MPNELQSTMLFDFLDVPDPAFSWKETPGFGSVRCFELVSQWWQAQEWKHTLWLMEPQERVANGVGLLLITGDEVVERDLPYAHVLCNMTGLPTAVLFQIPNQPLFGELREDDLIAHSFAKYIETEDPSWPLLFPMTRAAIRAMDAVQEITASTQNPIERFVVTGASKRGWTTWLAAATGDRRILGIAPQVYDNLNLPLQMRAQELYWGGPSPMLDDYTRRALQSLSDTDAGQALTLGVDPYSYISRIKVPKLIINGANDPYWTVDALSRYWDELHGPKNCLVVPNAGHELGDGVLAAKALGIFARHTAHNKMLPALEFEMKGSTAVIKAVGATGVRLWSAQSPDMHFDDKQWSVVVSRTTGTGNTGLRFDLPTPRHNEALLVTAEFGPDDGRYLLSSPVHLRYAEPKR